MTKGQGGLIPNIGERALIVGQTGSGKTAFALWLLIRVETAPVIIYDTKEESKFPKLPNSSICHTFEQVKEQYDNVEIDYIIFRPAIELLSKPLELDSLLMLHYQHFKHSVAYIDEAYSFHNAGRAGPGLVALLTRGRSRGITTIMSSQRPAMLSRFAITESQKLYVFRLADKQDRKRVGDIIPNFADMDLPAKHAFYYFESGQDYPELFKPIKLDPQFNTGYVDVALPDNEEGKEQLTEHLAKHVWI